MATSILSARPLALGAAGARSPAAGAPARARHATPWSSMRSSSGRRATLRRDRVAPPRAAAGEDTKPEKGTLDSLSSILGIDPEEEAAKQRAEEERVEREVAEAKRERDEALAARRTAEGNDAKNAPWGGVANTNTNRPSSGSGESMNAPERAIAAVSYLLPLLDGLKYSKFLLMQFPMFGLALLPLKPAIDVWYALGFLQIIVFFGLYLGVVQNREMSYAVRFNAQQAVLLDILLIGPDVLVRLVSGLGGDDALLTGGPGLEAQVLMYNTVFLYVYLTSVVGVGASALGKTVKLPLVGDAAENQTNMRG